MGRLQLITVFGLVCLFFGFAPGANTTTLAEAEQSASPRIEAVFVLDTTGSMSGLINAAKEKIWAIASSMAQTDPAPEIKLGLVAYRDRGDDYITKRTGLTTDLDSVYEQLMDYRADGGGDGPESVNQALYEAVNRMKWSGDKNAYKVIFLVGDAPPHMDYPNDVKYITSTRIASKNGIVINSIQCGNMSSTTPIWQQIAQLGQGEYFQVEQSGGAMIASTPYDAELAALADKLDDTRLYYGSKNVKMRAKKRAATRHQIKRKASCSARAQRAIFNSSKAGSSNFAGNGELLSELEDGRVELDEIEETALPEPIKKMNKQKRRSFVTKSQKERREIKHKIKTLKKRRAAHIKTKLEKTSDKGKGTLSQKVYDTIRAQAQEKNIKYKTEQAAY
ncbi:MAG: VWA domain-containing protein [Proteobacteria bacterium]|nr:VWA domain-containing protein [Pseudomonadota bacterium]